MSSYHCGTIVLTNRTKEVDGRTIDHQWVVDFDACPGDSGAPYLLNGVAYGIHTDSTTGCEPSKNQAWYSPIGWVLDVLAAQEPPGRPVHDLHLRREYERLDPARIARRLDVGPAASSPSPTAGS